MAHIYSIPFNQDPLVKLTQLLLKQERESLPNLSHTVVLLPDMSAAKRCRRILIDHAAKVGHNALLGPQIKTLQTWANEFSLLNNRIINDYARELILVEALLEHPNLYGQASPWLLAKSLLELFNQLTQRHITLPRSLDEFTLLLGKAYGTNNFELKSLSKEAHIVYSLWQAMHAQLSAQNLLDRATGHALRLNSLSQSLDNDTVIYIVGCIEFTQAEIDWINAIANTTRLTLIIQDDNLNADIMLPENISVSKTKCVSQQLTASFNFPHTIETCSTPFSDCLNNVYSYHSDYLLARASAFAKTNLQSPLQDSISVFLASGFEQEAQAIDLQVRLWLLEEKTNIAIVTENRRLARRIRALLERSDIYINDQSGWALSTTSASSVIERLLQTIEEDYHYQPLLDVLKSHFIFPQLSHTNLLETVYRFEQGIIIHENIASGILRYLKHIEYRKNKLPLNMADYYDDIIPLLNTVHSATTSLRELFTQNSSTPLQYINSLVETMESLGISTCFSRDEAGAQILSELKLMRTACQHITVKIDWIGFRTWLGQALEQFNFQPSFSNNGVQLLGLSQTALQQFDGIIIAGMEKEYLPGYSAISPFFNDEVRTILGLTTQHQYQLKRFYQFRQLLESITYRDDNDHTSSILLTAPKHHNDEDILLSPWLEALQAFHLLAYENDLSDPNMTQMLVASTTQTRPDILAPLPIPELNFPQVIIDKTLIPTQISASGYQQLLDCPYQFYASRCLKLAPQESVQKFLAKSDYGERIHLCLLAMHKNVKGLPGPFSDVITESNKLAAIYLLESISKQVFSADIEDNFVHRGWLRNWLKLIPTYIDWQIKQAAQWNIHQLETHIDKIQISPYINIGGVIDRIDINNNQLCIIDYKTGLIPSAEVVDSGEAIQLPFYALLAESQSTPKVNYDTQEVHYLSLSPIQFGLKLSLQKETLVDLKTQVAQRLDNIFELIHQGHSLPAWGDPLTCSRCYMDGLCRRQLWSQ